MVIIHLWGHAINMLQNSLAKLDECFCNPCSKNQVALSEVTTKVFMVCSGLILTAGGYVSIPMQAVNSMSCAPTSILTSKITECRHTSSDTHSSVIITSCTMAHVLACAPVCFFSCQACVWAFKNDCSSAGSLEAFLGPSNALIQALMSRNWVLSSSVRAGID